MNLSFPSLFASALSLTMLTCVLYFIMNKNKILARTGIISIYVFSILILLRGCLPFEFTVFHITKTYFSTRFIPAVQQLIDFHIIPGGESSPTVLSILLFVWISVGCLLLAKKLGGYHLYRKKLQKISYYPTEKINNAYISACRTVFPHKNITCRIIKTNEISTPAVFGISHRIILIPDIDYTEKELYYIFTHELLHVKHRDFVIKIICDLICSIYWWNPIISLLFPSMLKQTQELYVDYSINRAMTKSETCLYLNCLRKTSIISGKTPDSVYAFCSNTSMAKLKQRFVLITAKKTKGKPIICTLAAFLMILISFSFVFEASYRPKYDENGDRVFYLDENNSYFIKNGSEYDLYFSDEFFYTTPVIIEDFKDLPIYNRKP